MVGRRRNTPEDMDCLFLEKETLEYNIKDDSRIVSDITSIGTYFGEVAGPHRLVDKFLNLAE